MSQFPPSMKDDLRMSIATVILLQAIIAVVYIVPVESSPVLNMRLDLRMWEPALFLMPLLTLALDRWNVWLARWFAIISPALLVLGIYHQLAIPGILTLLAISTGLAAGLVGLRSAFATAAASALALLVYQRLTGSPDGWQMGVALVAILTTLVLAVSFIHPVRRFAEWAWTYYQNAIRVMQESQSQRADLNQALEELAHANRQLALLYEKQSALQHIAEEAERTKSAFVAKVSHEFRTPLNMIIGLAGVMVDNPHVYGRALPAALLEDLRIIHRNCEHLASLVNDVLALSQAQSGQLALRRETLRIEEIITEALDVVRPLVMKKKLKLSVEISPDLQEISCDRTRIRQVILNLLSNAARFTDQGGITLRAEDQQGSVLLVVEDTGPGISQKDKERIFEPFCQGSEQGWLDKGGSGLGLTISKQFVELHGGKIWLESEPGEGTSFFVSLPKSTPIGPVIPPSRWISKEWTWLERPQPPSHLPGQPARPRIVVCDRFNDLNPLALDDPSLVEVEQTCALEDMLASVERIPAHAVLLRGLEKNGLAADIELARRSLPDTPLIGFTVPERIAPALEAGANQYLVKPVHPSTLHKALQSLALPARRVLVVDDDDDTRRLLERMVSLYDPGVEVAQAANGREALRVLRKQPADLLLLDLIMPDMDGMQVLAEIRADDRLRHMQVMIISAQDPSDVQPVCHEMLVTMGDGIQLAKVLECALGFSEILFKPEPPPAPLPALAR